MEFVKGFMETPQAVQLNDKRIIRGWAFFDWANSAYALVITAAIFPAYFLQVTQSELSIGHQSISNSSMYAYAISIAYLCIAFLNPLLSGIADYSGRRKRFLKFFTYLGSTSCIMLFFFQGMDQLWWGTIFFIIATIGFAGALVFYNAYLPVIASEDRYDDVSAQGFAYGYIGSVLLLMVNLLMIIKPEWFGLPEGSLAPRISFVMVGLWWLGFSQITFRRLPVDQPSDQIGQLLQHGFRQIRDVWKRLRHQKYIKRFLFAFFCYSAGVQTVLYMAATFAEKELQFGSQDLIIIILILQLVAIGGAYLFAFMSDRVGNKLALSTMLLLWISICIVAYFVQEKVQFYAVAAAVGMVMGGIQSLSRSTYSKMIDDNEGDLNSYFSFYDVLEKIAIVLGTFSFGFVEQMTGGMRNSVLVLALYFIIGLIILSRVDIKRFVAKS